MNGKTGIGIITCNRQDFYERCYDSVINSEVDEIVTVNDGDEYSVDTSSHPYIHHEQNKGVGISKNRAMKHLLEKGCDHIFLIEDDIIIKDPTVYGKYINTAKETGVWHMMYGYHGPANKTVDKAPNPRLVIEYNNNIKLALNRHCVGAFCYYFKGVLNNVGLNDERFTNAWEHVEHSYRHVKMGLLPGYWWWPDVADSYNLLDEQACSEDSSAIRPRSDWQDNIQNGAQYFQSKHGHSPVAVPDLSQDQILEKLKQINKLYKKI